MKKPEQATTMISDKAYLDWLKELKEKVRHSQLKAAVAVNSALIEFYWELGADIVNKQKATVWGTGFLSQLSRDLMAEFPEMKGFSERNLQYARKWYLFYSKELTGCATSCVAITQQPVAQLAKIPWGHNNLIVTKCKSVDQALYYVQKTIQNGWSRAVLEHQIESGLFQREGKAITNFEAVLPATQSDLARETLKDPYCFDFLALTERHNERELEDALVEHVTKFLIELGAGFSYLGRQVRLEVEGDEFFMDLLFYHVKLHCYVVVELKTTKFKPEYAGKLNFYVSAVDGKLKDDRDSPTIGILICKSKTDMVVEYSLRDVNKPIGVSEYTITRDLPEVYVSSLPSIEALETELRSHDE